MYHQQVSLNTERDIMMMAASVTTSGATTAAAINAAIANAIKASGVLIRVESEEFNKIMQRNREGLVVYATGGVFTKNHQYLSSYKGLTFYTKTSEPLILPSKCEIIQAKRIWIPG
jgi:uncharacterized protein (DUF2147 family)